MFIGTCALSLRPALAVDGEDRLLDPTPVAGWTVTVTGTVQVGPRYAGAWRYGLGGLPSIGWRRIGTPDRFSAPDDSLDYTLWDAGRFSFGPVIAFDFGRSRSDDARLVGLRSVPFEIEPGFFMEYWPIEDHLRGRIEVRRGLRADAGFVGDLSIDWVEHLGRFTVSGGPRLSLGDTAAMRANFAVTPAEAAANGHVFAFDPSGGTTSFGLEAAAAYAVSDVSSATLFGRYDRMAGDAAKSPVVNVFGSRSQFTLGISISRSFDILTGP